MICRPSLAALFLRNCTCLLAVSLLTVPQALIDVLVPPLQHAVDESGELVGHGGDRFRGAEPGTETARTLLRAAHRAVCYQIRHRLPRPDHRRPVLADRLVKFCHGERGAGTDVLHSYRVRSPVSTESFISRSGRSVETCC